MKDDLVYIEHILSCIDRIRSYTEGLDYDSFLEKQVVQDAIVRQLEIIGEATKRVSTEYRDRYPHIPWKVMAGMRDKLIHDYIDVDFRMVWSTATEDIPELESLIKELL
jgi:uncharacterized protein with HEPN domain